MRSFRWPGFFAAPRRGRREARNGTPTADLAPRWCRRFGVGGVLAFALLLARQGWGQGAPAVLFVDSTPAIEAAALSSDIPPYSSLRLVRLNPVAVAQLNGLPAGAPLRFLVDLFAGELHTAVIERGERIEPDRVVCWGYLENQRGSEVILALSRAAMAGSIFLPGRETLQIQYAGDGWQRIAQFDAEQMPPCGVTNRFDSSSGLFAAGAMKEGWSKSLDPSAALTNSILDLLVVYTQAARIGAGGTDGMNALIDAAVAELNSAFENSRVLARVQLVCRAEIDYEETGDIDDDLDNLENDDRESTTDAGPIRGVHQLRRQYRADLVTLITETTGGPLGLANVMSEMDVEFTEKAFNIVQRQFANAYEVLAHEVGHNLGCQHDRATTASRGCFDFSHAYVFVVQGMHYHTVMSYQSGMPIPYFSNPDVSFLGVPTGIGEGATNSANNALTLNLTTPTAAQFSSYLRPGTPPQVALVAPTNGAVFGAGAVSLAAEASGEDPPVEVEFWIDGVQIAEVEDPPFTFIWTNDIPGTYAIRAVAKDSVGWETTTPAAIVNLTPPAPVFEVQLVDGIFTLRARGWPGQAFRIDASSDLLTWAPMLTNRFTSGSFNLIDDQSNRYPVRFYRIDLVP